jgi:hypothetical protein
VFGENGTESGRRAEKDRALGQWKNGDRGEGGVIELFDYIDGGRKIQCKHNMSLLVGMGRVYNVKVCLVF